MQKGGDANDKNPVLSVAVARNDKPDGSRSWFVRHYFSEGSVDRHAQYEIYDTGTKNPQWRGYLRKQRNIVMQGDVKPFEQGFLYTETMVDTWKNDLLLMKSVTRCITQEQFDQAQRQQQLTPEYTPPVPQLPTQPGAPGYAQPLPDGRITPRNQRTSVPMHTTNGKAYYVDVQLGGVPARMLVDTGATDSLITRQVATWIVTNNKGKVTGTAKSRDATGKLTEQYVIQIYELVIGPHTVKNVEATVSETADVMLLGLDVIDGIGVWSFDTRNKVLVWN